jgi:uncharacterized protein
MDDPDLSSRGRQPQPWYREPWPWILMAGPAAVVVAGFYTLALAIRSDDGLVADDYYRRGLAINKTLGESERARQLALGATVSISGNHVRVVLRGHAVPPRTLRLDFIHPTRAGHDQTLMLPAAGAGIYQAEFVPFGDEPRRIRLEDDRASWRLSGTLTRGQSSAVLGADG